MSNKENLVITIGRQFGSGGRELGKKLADRLGIKYYDKELLSEAARRAGMNEEFFKQNDERFPSFINGVFSFAFGFNPVNCYAGATSISSDSLYRAQSDFIHSLAAEEPCVIVGRSSDYVLRDHGKLLNIFVHADEDSCAERIMRRHNDEHNKPSRLPHSQAKALGRKINKLRANYYNFYTDKTWGAASSYDLTFDTSKMSMDDIVEVVVEYINRRFPDSIPSLK